MHDNNTCLRSVISRRALIGLSLALWANPLHVVASTLRTRWHIPAENAPHAGCWMAWPARSDVWGHDLSAVRDVCARVARAVGAFEPVTMFARPSHAKQAATACGPRIRVVSLQIDGCWIRDTGPLIAADREGVLAGSVLNFNGWGNKQPHTADAKVAARLCESLGVVQHIVPFVSEGGAWEFDGEATALTTESAVLNPNRNPQLTKADVESAGRRFFGVDKIIWLPGARDYWTDGHVDGIARFVRPGHVVIETASDPRDPDAPWLARDAAALRS
ncbi:MAG TPA: agmatine deiminase family protein, partial [Candidatus Eremiobacteraceae bacterium]|nr:agmatine deiminase family protein [Candidatus Eremiobacteraceae bacterium]